MNDINLDFLLNSQRMSTDSLISAEFFANRLSVSKNHKKVADRPNNCRFDLTRQKQLIEKKIQQWPVILFDHEPEISKTGLACCLCATRISMTRVE